MTEFPDISVVMGVYNGASQLIETMDSVLSQRDVRFEFVIVDDGSSDATPAILEAYAARDSRVRLRRQGRLGLTRALIAGCAGARAPVIARQDCGDVSLPGRLSKQLGRLRAEPSAGLASVGTEFIGPRGERLYAVRDSDAAFDAGLAATSIGVTRGPSHHGATMFRRAAYDAAGGYRAAFAVAQDLDLWMRLWEHSSVIAVPEILYRARLQAGSLSATRRREQVAYTRILLEGARARRSGRPDGSIEACLRLSPAPDISASNAAADFAYFLARVLEAKEPERARVYLDQALRANPLFPRAWIAWIRLRARAWRRASLSKAAV